MATVFMVAAIIVGFIGKMSEENLVKNFVAGAGELLGVALIIGVARGVVVIMDAGFLSDTVLHWSAGVVTGLSDIAFINAMYWLQVLMSFFVPSSSGLAVLSMPIMAPLADFVGVGRDRSNFRLSSI